MVERWGQVTLQGSPELLGVPGVLPGLGPGGEEGTPLPTSTASGEAPPSTGVSGGSSSRSVDRLYSTICQTTGGANPSQKERAGPPSRLQRGPFLLTRLSGLGSLRRPALQGCRPSCTSWRPCPMPPAPPPHPRAGGLYPGARSPHSLCHRRPAPATRRSWWSQDGQHLRAPRV